MHILLSSVNNAKDNGVKVLSDNLKYIPHLNYLNLWSIMIHLDNKITIKGLKPLCKELKCISNVSTLNLSGIIYIFI